VRDNGPYFVAMVAGWTAWVCVCALVYAGIERLFDSRTSSAND
jgi:hypothetical protein